ncbi:MAG: hypothetical protein ACYC5Q_02185 [Thermoleophilia bacterium]
MLLLYAGGMAAVAAAEYGTLSALLTSTHTWLRGEKARAIETLYPRLLADALRDVPGHGNAYVPLSNRLHDVLRPMLRELLPFDQSYDESFDEYEYLTALLMVDLTRSEGRELYSVPIGRFGWTSRRYPGPTVIDRVTAERDRYGADWGPVKAGLFQGSLDRAIEAKQHFDQYLKQVTGGWL